MLRRWANECVDEFMGAVLLHAFMRYRRRAPLRGPSLAEIPELYCGDPHQFYQPRPEPVDLSQRSFPVRTAGPFAVHDFCFPSSSSTNFPENNLVWGRRWRPLEIGSDLTVIGVDGIVQLGNRWFTRFARRLVPHGHELITMDTPFNHRRTPAGYRPGQLIMGGDVNHQLAVARQAVLDLWTVIRSVRSTGRRVGLVGVSYGGWLVLMTAVVAREIDFVVAVAPPIDIAQLIQEGGTIMRAVRRGIGRRAIDFDRITELATVMTPSKWNLPLSGEAVTLHAARYDRFVPPHRVAELADKWHARYLEHNVAHYGLAVAATAPKIIAADVLRHDIASR